MSSADVRLDIDASPLQSILPADSRWIPHVKPVAPQQLLNHEMWKHYRKVHAEAPKNPIALSLTVHMLDSRPARSYTVWRAVAFPSQPQQWCRSGQLPWQLPNDWARELQVRLSSAPCGNLGKLYTKFACFQCICTSCATLLVQLQNGFIQQD